jgi:nitroreductase
MNYDDVVRGRRSIRGFLKKPVPKALVREVVELAMRAPSSLNTQPWNFYVVAGDPLDRIRQGNTERNIAGVCNRAGNVFGLMPHPERAADILLGNTDGAALLATWIGALEEVVR